MTGHVQWLIQYFATQAHYAIPVYQRSYDWKIEQCAQLYDDLMEVRNRRLDSHFFGSIVAVSDPNAGMMNYIIIDGQQRLTTVSLLLLAMQHLIEDGEAQAADQPKLADKLESYLVDPFAADNAWRFKIRPAPEDERAYETLFNRSTPSWGANNFAINYNYFRQRILDDIEKGHLTIGQLAEAIDKLQVVNITLSPPDQPQMVFESLNSTGLALTEGDKIRNFVLMGLSNAKQTAFYKKYWKEIVRNASEDSRADISPFVRDYLSVKQRAIPNIKDVYARFKSFSRDESGKGRSTEDVLREMLAYAKRYNRLINPEAGGPGSKELEQSLYRLNRLKTTVTRPFLLEVLRMQDEGGLTQDEVTEVAHIMESYLFRRLVCGVPTNALNKVFLFLHSDIMSFDGTAAQYVEKLAYILASGTGARRFPTDEEFLAAFSQKDVYQMRSETKKYLFERLENGNLKAGAIGVWDALDEGELTIEHVIPQTLTRAWAEDLGEEYERVHAEWLHRIANLTLTAYNTQYRNHRFQDKKTMEGGFEQGGLHINWWIRQQEHWTEAELRERDVQLRQTAAELWPRPQSTYIPPVKQRQSVSLDEEVDLTGRMLDGFIFHGVEYPASKWNAMYTQVLQMLHEKDKLVLKKIAADGAGVGLSYHFITVPDPQIATQKIDEGLHVRTHSSTMMKIGVLRKLFPLFGEDPEDLTFKLKDKDKVADAQAESEPASAQDGSLCVPVQESTTSA